jgi:hypothetical protein
MSEEAKRRRPPREVSQSIEFIDKIASRVETLFVAV